MIRDASPFSWKNPLLPSLSHLREKERRVTPFLFPQHEQESSFLLPLPPLFSFGEGRSEMGLSFSPFPF